MIFSEIGCNARIDCIGWLVWYYNTRLGFRLLGVSKPLLLKGLWFYIPIIYPLLFSIAVWTILIYIYYSLFNRSWVFFNKLIDGLLGNFLDSRPKDLIKKWIFLFPLSLHFCCFVNYLIGKQHALIINHWVDD